MKRKGRKKKFHPGVFFVLLTAMVVAVTAFMPWVMKPESLRKEKNAIHSILYGEFEQDSYNAKSLLLVDRSNNNVIISKNEKEQQIPASLAKLFVIEYASTLADLDSVVSASYEAISLTKPGSSVAGIEVKDYFLHNLFAAMLVC